MLRASIPRAILTDASARSVESYAAALRQVLGARETPGEIHRTLALPLPLRESPRSPCAPTAFSRPSGGAHPCELPPAGARSQAEQNPSVVRNTTTSIRPK